MRFRLLGFFALVVAPAYCGSLLNGSFETGAFTDWTTGGNFTFTRVTSGPYYFKPPGVYIYNGAQSGNWYVTSGAQGAPATIQRTVTDTIGANYSLSFWLNSDGDSPSEFLVSWNGNVLLDASDPNSSAVWTNYSYHVTGTGSDTILFGFRDDPGYLAFDNATLTGSVVATPEPATFFPMAAGLLGLAYHLRRRVS